MSDFWSDRLSTAILHVCEQRKLWRDCADATGLPEPSLVAYVISTIISWAGSNVTLLTPSSRSCIFEIIKILIDSKGPVNRTCIMMESWETRSITYHFCNFTKILKSSKDISCYLFCNGSTGLLTLCLNFHIQGLSGKFVDNINN